MPPRVEATLAKVRKIALSLPLAEEKISHGAPVFHVKGKLFVMFADNHHGDGRLAVWCKATHEAQRAFIDTDEDRYFVPPYVGPSGWIGVRLDRSKTSWKEVAAIFEQSWQMIAPKRLPAPASATKKTAGERKK